MDISEAEGRAVNEAAKCGIGKTLAHVSSPARPRGQAGGKGDLQAQWRCARRPGALPFVSPGAHASQEE
ncbi:hypothetical protein [Ancylobacter sp.]|uniref:hypothetical protein n=1 Tax=Ancylobacter sp. TaxID=1872567 RepID=UPI003BAB3196